MVWLNVLKNFVLGSGKTYIYIAIGLFISSVCGYIYYQDYKIKEQKKEIVSLIEKNTSLHVKLDETIKTNKANIKTFELYKMDTQKTLELMKKQHKEELEKEIAYTKILKDIEDVKKDDDGVAATVLVNAFDRLQQLQTKATDNNKNKD